MPVYPRTEFHMAHSKQALISQPYSAPEERLNCISHGLGFLLAITGLVYLIADSNSTMAITVSAIYGSSLILMFLSSTIYHGVSSPVLKFRFKIIDHSAIYLLIAGTYTPFLLLGLDSRLGIVATVVIWSIGLFGIAFKIIAQGAFPKISVATYLVMGWLALVLIYPLYQSLAEGAFWLLLAGGLCFSVGVFFYVAKKVKYTHAIWHLFVVAGCTCHYFSIYNYLL
jgi:hemolysin III